MTALNVLVVWVVILGTAWAVADRMTPTAWAVAVAVPCAYSLVILTNDRR